MTLPTVSELVRGLEPVTRDPFMDGLDTVAPHPGAARELLDRHQVTNVRSAVADVAPVALLVGTVVRQLASGDFASISCGCSHKCVSRERSRSMICWRVPIGRRKPVFSVTSSPSPP